MLQFVREIPIRIVLQETPSARRGFLFHLAAGFSRQDGQLDPLSGMSVNLMHVDSWLAEVKAQAEQNSCSDLHGLMQAIRSELSGKATSRGAQLCSLMLREERGWSLSWSQDEDPAGIRWAYSHYLEMLPLTGNFELLRVSLTWLRPSSCDADLPHEGFKIMKSLQNTSGLSELLEKLKPFKGTTLSSGCLLEDIRIHLCSQDILLTL